MAGEKQAPYLSVLTESEEQTAVAAACPEVFRIYLDSSSGTDFINNSSYKEISREAKGRGKELFLAMPHIFRETAVVLLYGKYGDTGSSLTDF